MSQTKTFGGTITDLRILEGELSEAGSFLLESQQSLD